MNEIKHTPGPWQVTKFASSCFCVHPANSENERDDICRVSPHNYHPDGIQAAFTEAESNAALIAQAPELLAEVIRLRQINAELLAALEDASFLLAKIGKFPGDLPQFMDSIIRSVQDARASIAKTKE